jgi:hypothetical protein
MTGAAVVGGDLATVVTGASILAMTSETPRAVDERQTAWVAAEAHGCDMSLLESNLSKAPAERLRAHGRALAAALTLREA